MNNALADLLLSYWKLTAFLPAGVYSSRIDHFVCFKGSHILGQRRKHHIPLCSAGENDYLRSKVLNENIVDTYNIKQIAEDIVYVVYQNISSSQLKELQFKSSFTYAEMDIWYQNILNDDIWETSIFNLDELFKSSCIRGRLKFAASCDELGFIKDGI